jgi:hypothetical protein
LALLFIESKRNKNELSAAAASLQMHIMRVLVELAQFMSHKKKRVLFVARRRARTSDLVVNSHTLWPTELFQLIGRC